MAQKRLSMRKIRDVLRLKYELGRSHREAGLFWLLPDELDDRTLEVACVPRRHRGFGDRSGPGRGCTASWRGKDVPLQLLWLEYREVHPDGYQRAARSVTATGSGDTHPVVAGLDSVARADKFEF